MSDDSSKKADATNNKKVKFSSLANQTIVEEPTLETPSSSIFSWDYWQDQFDQERLKRLQQCHTLQLTLKACESRHNKKKKPVEAPQLDEYGGGMRMLMYYQWRNQIEVNQKGCVPEKHSMWTCRAIALACGKELREMKDCFMEKGPDTMMAQRQTAYEGDKTEAKKAKIPCYDMQRALGQCVATNARSLEEKINRRKKPVVPKEQPQSKE